MCLIASYCATGICCKPDFPGCSRDRVFTRTTLAIAGILAVIFGIAAGYGLAMAIGLPFTSLQQVRHTLSACQCIKVQVQDWQARRGCAESARLTQFAAASFLRVILDALIAARRSRCRLTHFLSVAE